MPDEVALYGLLRTVRDVGLPLLTVNTVEASQADRHPILAYQHESSATANGVNQPKIRTILSSQK